ncbi:hypothetical protein TK49_07255 [Ralstonia mannitolilytica]|nr:hypothetical protein TK49_07255 [Ralstonia mannitolilytica]
MEADMRTMQPTRKAAALWLALLCGVDAAFAQVPPAPGAASAPLAASDAQATHGKRGPRTHPKDARLPTAAAPSSTDGAGTSAGSRGSGGSDGLPGTGAAAGSGGSADMRGEPVRKP